MLRIMIDPALLECPEPEVEDTIHMLAKRAVDRSLPPSPSIQCSLRHFELVAAAYDHLDHLRQSFRRKLTTTCRGTGRGEPRELDRVLVLVPRRFAVAKFAVRITATDFCMFDLHDGSTSLVAIVSDGLHRGAAPNAPKEYTFGNPIFPLRVVLKKNRQAPKAAEFALGTPAS
jgi:hypothetical protein